MYEHTLTPSRSENASRRQVNLILADGQIITVYCLEASKTRVRIAIRAPETVKISIGSLDMTP